MNSKNWSLLTDLYQLTMAYGYWRTGRSGEEAVFNLFFRENPKNYGYVLFAGLAPALEWLNNFRIQISDVEYLATLKGSDGRALFDQDFFKYLLSLKMELEIAAPREGSVVFAREPLLRVRGPLILCQIAETALLNIINFQTLIATKAARIRGAAGDKTVIEFGLRRAQGMDGAMAASRAAYIGGCDATSNVLAGQTFGIPVRGTHAHSWVMSFDNEVEAFLAYAQAMPNNGILLVDTYDSLQGVRHAVEVAQALKAKGFAFGGIRLDSGDLAYLSIEARKILDAGGFPDAKIVASNDLDENLIETLNLQGARIDIWGVGTRLVTSYDHPALGGVYKLAALKKTNGRWQPTIKLSEQISKTTIPGLQQVRRYRVGGVPVADMIYDAERGVSAATIVDPLDETRQKRINSEATYTDLLQPVSGPQPTLPEIRSFAQKELATFHPSILRLVNPHLYPVGLEPQLFKMRKKQIAEQRKLTDL